MGSTRRKLRKLIRDPERFVSDFVIKNIPNAARIFQYRKRKRPVAFFEETVQVYDEFSFETFLDELSSAIPVLLSISAKSYELGLLEGHVFTFLEKSRAFGACFDLHPFVEVRGHHYFVDSYLSEELMLLFRTASWFRLHLSESKLSESVLTIDTFIYRKVDGLYYNSSPTIELRHIPAEMAAKFMVDVTGVWTTQELLLGRKHDSVEPCEPVDLVYTWVDSADENWQKLYARYCGASIDLDRYKSRNELQYSLRSIHYNCSWIRKIHIVSNCAAPAWLNTDHDKINWVDHSQILDHDVLPTFNSHAIEAGLHRIPGLADRFIYFNDDVFATRPIRASLFFDALGRTSSFLETVGQILPKNLSAEKSWFHARVKAQSLLLTKLGYAATTMHQHVPFAIRREHYDGMVAEFGPVTKAVEMNRQRTNDDIPLVAFLYPHYSIAVGRGVQETVACQTLNDGNYETFSLSSKSVFLCINDGKGTGDSTKFNEVAIRLMARHFPISASWEQ